MLAKPQLFKAFRATLLLLASLFLWQANTNASHIVGIEINYACLGGSNYEVSLSVYRDCSGISLGTTQNVSLTSTCGASLTSVLTLNGTYDVSDVCFSQLSNTTCTGGIFPGMEHRVYTGTVNLAGCNTWDVSFSQCCRNNTVNLPPSGNFYTHSQINLIGGACNNSPVFPSNRPVPYVAQYSTQSVLSYVAFDPDGDNLVYSLVSAQTAANTNSSYIAGFSASAPIGAGVLSINPNTGLLTVSNPQFAGNYVVVVKVEEFDNNGTSKGFVLRESQFVVIPSSNNNPTSNNQIFNVTGGTLAPGTNTISALNGAYVCFDIAFSDPDTNDTLSAFTSLTQYFPGATITTTGTNPLTATVCAIVNSSSGFNPIFTVSAGDNACPISAKHNVAVQFQLPNVVATGPDVSFCDGDTAFINAFGDSAYTWSVLSGDPIVPGTNFGCTTCASTWATPSVTTTYLVTGAPTGTTATIVVTPLGGPVIGLSNDTTVCSGSCVTVTATGGGNYFWSTASTAPSIVVCTPGVYTVSVSDSNGCTAVDTFILGNFAAPSLTISADTSICAGDSVALMANGNGSIMWSNGTVGSSNVVSAGGTYSATLTDANGCTAIDSVTVTVHPLPNVYAGPDTVFCLGDTVTLTATGATSYLWSNGATTASASFTTPGMVTVTGTNAQGCSSSDNVLLIPNSARYVGGYVTDSNGIPLTNSKVYIIKYFAAQDSVVALDSVLTDSNGFYLFGTVENVVYVKSAPDSGAYPNKIPTYHGSAPVFQMADSVVTIPCDTAWANITNLCGTNLGGPGFVQGYIFQGAGKADLCQGDPVKQLSLVLLDANGTYIAQTVTDENGEFSFANITPGTYTIWADQPGIDLAHSPSLTLQSGSSSIDSYLHFKVDRLEACNPSGIGSSLAELSNLNVFPNPSNGEVTLELSMESATAVTVQVMDALGATVWQEQLPGNGKQVRKTIDLSHLSSGMYFLRVDAANSSETRKLVLR